MSRLTNTKIKIEENKISFCFTSSFMLRWYDFVLYLKYNY